jgi:hypothetical protein
MGLGIARRVRGHGLARERCARLRRAAVESLEARQMLSTTSAGGPIVTPSHVVIVIEEDRAANAIGDTTNMPYFNQLASTGLVYTKSQGLNTSSQAGEMSYLGLFSGSTQGVTDDSYHGPFSGPNLAQSLNNAGLSFAGYSESMPRAGDTTDNYAASPTNPAYDDLYMRAYNPMSQFTNEGTGKTNAQVNLTFASFPTSTAGYASLPAVSFVIPNTLHNTHGSNDTNPYATDPSSYNLLRQNADSWLKNNLDGYLQWAKQNNSLLIVTDDEGDRAHVFANGFATIINGDPRLFDAGTDTKSVTPYNLLRTIEDMYGVAPLGSSATAADYDTDATGKLAPTSSGVTLSPTTTALSSSLNPATAGQNVTLTATVSSSATGTPTGTVSFYDGSSLLGSGTLSASDVATFTTSSLSATSHSITANYSGNSVFAGSTSAALSEQINAASNAPANDNFANRLVLSGTSITVTGTNVNATKEAGEPNHGGNAGGKSVWYSWTAPSTGVVSIDTHGSNFDTLLGVYTGTSVAALTTVASNDDDPAGGTTTSKVTFATTAGTTYQIAVDGYGGVSGSITLNLSFSAGALQPPTGLTASNGTYSDGVHLSWAAVSGATAYEVYRYTSNDSTKATQVNASDITGTTYDDTATTPGVTYYYWVTAKNASSTSAFSSAVTGYRATIGPANDNFANRIAITGTTVTVTGSNVGASKEPGEPSTLAGNSGGRSVWWTWTAPTSGKVTLDTHGSNFDTLLGVYTGTSVSALTLIGANDDDPAGGTTTSKLVFNAVAGTTYQIQVDGYGGASGNITLNLSLA